MLQVNGGGYGMLPVLFVLVGFLISVASPVLGQATELSWAAAFDHGAAISTQSTAMVVFRIGNSIGDHRRRH